MFALNFKKDPVAGGSYTFSTKDQGQILVTDIGDQRIVRKETWGALINHGMDAYEFGYEGGGQLEISVNDAGKLEIKGDGSVHRLGYKAR